MLYPVIPVLSNLIFSFLCLTDFLDGVAWSCIDPAVVILCREARHVANARTDSLAANQLAAFLVPGKDL